MKFITSNEVNGIIGWLFVSEPGYKKILGFYFWNWSFGFEFGKGDGYDWDTWGMDE